MTMRPTRLYRASCRKPISIRATMRRIKDIVGMFCVLFVCLRHNNTMQESTGTVIDISISGPMLTIGYCAGLAWAYKRGPDPRPAHVGDGIHAVANYTATGFGFAVILGIAGGLIATRSKIAANALYVAAAVYGLKCVVDGAKQRQLAGRGYFEA